MDTLTLSNLRKGGVLSDVRVAKIESERASKISPGRGNIKVVLKRQFKAHSANQAIFEVSLKVDGYSAEAVNATDFDFSIFITVQSLWIWENQEKVDFTELKMLADFFEPSFIIGVEKVREIARSLGFGSVKFPYNLLANSATTAKEKPVARKKPTRKGKVVKTD